MKTSIAFLVLVLCGLYLGSPLFAQIGLKFGPVKYEKIVFNYQNPPLEILSDEYKNYQVIIHPGDVDFKYIRYVQPFAWTSASVGNAGSSNYGSVALAQQEFINLNGYTKVDTDPDFTIECTFKNMSILATELRVLGDNCHSYRLKYNYGAQVKAYDKNGHMLLDTLFVNPDHTYFAWFGRGGGGTGEPTFSEQNGITFCYKSKAELDSRFANDYHYFPIKLTKEYLLQAEHILQDKYTYHLLNKEFYFAYDKTTKKVNNDDLIRAIDLVKEGAALMNEGETKEKFEPVFSSAISIWEKALEEVDLIDKSARINAKLAPSLCRNIALLAIFNEDWAKVGDILQKASDLNPDSNTQVLQDFSDNRQQRLAIYSANK